MHGMLTITLALLTAVPSSAATSRVAVRVYGQAALVQEDGGCREFRGARYYRALPGGQVAVEESLARRIAIYGSDGRLVKALGNADWTMDAVGDFCLEDGSLVYIQERDQALVRLDMEGRFLAFWSPPEDLGIERMTTLERAPDGRLFVGDTEAGRILVLSKSFEVLNILPWAGNGFAVTPKGKLVTLKRRPDAEEIVSYGLDYQPVVHARIPRPVDTHLFLEAVTGPGHLLVTAIDGSTGKGKVRWTTGTGKVLQEVDLPPALSRRPVRAAPGGGAHMLVHSGPASTTGGFAILEVDPVTRP